MNTPITIDHQFLNIDDLWPVIKGEAQIGLSGEALNAVVSTREYLEKKLTEKDTRYYGINTGFGSLCNVKIDDEELSDLQQNLVRSHAVGMGDLVPEEIIRLILFLKIKSLSFGFSGVRKELLEQISAIYNAGILPVTYELGSLGASGDLAPLAHLGLSLIGEGEVHYRGAIVPAAEALKEAGIRPLKLQAKEGLAILNGTQFSGAHAAWCQIHGERISKLADIVAALSLDAYNGKIAAFSPWVTRIRPHGGAIRTAENIRELLKDSSLGERESGDVQDPYSFRCIPQVHGATRDALKHTRQILETEINSVTDNPSIIARDDLILSGGNFHAQPLALGLDYLAISLAELGSISERRIYQLIHGNRDLPVYLTEGAGLNSGMMIPQYTAASIVSQNKQLCTPASVDSIISSRGQEDHVSMAANSGTKAVRVVNNVYRILAIEWMSAAQAIENRRPAKTGKFLEELLERYRTLVKPLKEDRVLYKDLEKTVEFFSTIDLSDEKIR